MKNDDRTSQRELKGERPSDSSEAERLSAFLRNAGIRLLVVGNILSSVLMLALFVVGFWLIISTIVMNGPALLSHGSSSQPSSAAPPSRGSLAVGDPRTVTIGVLHGLEFFFLAPLPALVFLSLSRLFMTHLERPRTTDASRELSGTHALHRVKALVLSLMIASIATDLLRRVFQGISIMDAAPELAVMVVLGLYWLTLERLSR